MVEIKLKDRETGYEKVGKLIKSWWDVTSIEDSIVALEISDDGITWERCNEVAYPTDDLNDVEFLNDWWEGEKYIRVLWITSVDQIGILRDKLEDKNGKEARL